MDRPGPRPSAHDLERYAGLFAARTRVMKSTAMRDLMALIDRPEVISLAGGLPDTSTFPPDSYASIMDDVARQNCARALQYGPTEGFGAMQKRIAEVMAAEDTPIDPDDVLVTTGAQQAIDLVCKALLDPGDIVIAEAPTYPGAIPSFCAYEADVRQVEMDSDGLRIDELEALLAQLAAEGRKPKFIYTIPSFHNPAGVTMSLPRRKRLVEVAREQEIMVVEDNPYGLLRFEGDPLPSLLALDSPSAAHHAGGFVVHLGTFSKILSPGVRLGWAVGPGPVIAKMRIGKMSADLCSSSMTQFFVDAYFEAGDWLDYVRSLRAIYKRRRDTMLEALAENFGPECSWTRPEGGLFVWMTLPDYIDTTDLLARALDEHVAFVPGEAAYVDGRGRSSLRLNFSAVPEDDIREGIRRIGKVVNSQVGLYGTLTGAKAVPVADAGTTPQDSSPQDDPELADVLELPRRGRPAKRAR